MQLNIAIKKNFSFILKTFKQEDVRFRLVTMLKLTLLSIFPFILVIFLLSLFYKFNILYFNSINEGSAQILDSTLIDFLVNRISNFFLPLSIFICCLMIVSLYVADLMLRPFNTISEYCQKKMNGDNDVGFDPFFYADLKLINTFGDLFFHHIDDCEEKGQLSPYKVPKKFLQIHKPVIENGFFIHFGFWIMISSIVTLVLLNILSTELHNALIEYSMEILKKTNATQSEFLIGQREIYNSIVWGILVSYFCACLVMVGHLYNQVSKPAFAYFSTMRSFLKGKHNTRVHMLGYYYIRDHSRIFNKYLDFLCRELKSGYYNK